MTHPESDRIKIKNQVEDPMISFLFWNIMRKDFRQIVTRAVVENSVDVLLLAESGIPDHFLVEVLTEASGEKYIALSDEPDKVKIFTRLTSYDWIKRYTGPNGRASIWTGSVGLPPGILLATAHLSSVRGGSMSNQALEARQLATEILRAEEYVGFDRTILVGDFNMNPFDAGVVEADALHAVMTKEIAEKGRRTVQGINRPFFYNPMWGYFGDRTVGPPGTFYYSTSSSDALFWHMLDQVLLRPSLMNSLKRISIIDAIGSDSLVNRNQIPDKNDYSDHLPLLFDLDI